MVVRGRASEGIQPVLKFSVQEARSRRELQLGFASVEPHNRTWTAAVFSLGVAVFGASPVLQGLLSTDFFWL